jgi:hypothetical protein
MRSEEYRKEKIAKRHPEKHGEHKEEHRKEEHKREEHKERGKKDDEEHDTKKSGSFEGKSNKLGEGGRAAQLKAKGVPQGVIGAIAREKGAAPGQAHFHKG